jgi:4-coumarate--CoA ligase
MLCSWNSIWFPVVLMGTIMAGGIYTSGNPTYTPRELAYQLKDSGARFLLAAESVLDMAEKAVLAGMKKDQLFIFNDEVLHGKSEDKGRFCHWNALIASSGVGARFKWRECSTVKETNETIVLNYSSGTTGLPKGVESTHYNYIANCAQVNHQLSLDPLFPTVEDVARRSRWLCTIPLYHGFAQIQFGIVAAKRGVPVYMMKTPNFGELLRNIERFQISELTLVPPIMVAMAKKLNSNHGRKELSSVLRVFCGAAPLGRDIQKQVEKLWPTGVVNVKQGWGMTE